MIFQVHRSLRTLQYATIDRFQSVGGSAACQAKMLHLATVTMVSVELANHDLLPTAHHFARPTSFNRGHAQLAFDGESNILISHASAVVHRAFDRQGFACLKNPLHFIWSGL